MIAIVIVSLFALAVVLLVVDEVANGAIKASKETVQKVKNSDPVRNIAERRIVATNEARLKDFKASQECPKCGTVDFHSIEDIWLGKGHWQCIRRCYSCGHGWYQW